MKNSVKRKAEIRTLRSFCKNDKLDGMIANMGLDFLARQYPFHFLLFSKKYGTHTGKREEVKRVLKDKFEYVRYFILSAPQSASERLILKTMLSEFEAIVERTE